jgi:hypothetical protein
MARIADFVLQEADHIGQLTENGLKEHRSQADRLWKRNEKDLRRGVRDGRTIVLEASDKLRTRGSRSAFVEGLLAAAHPTLSRTERDLFAPPPSYMGAEGWGGDAHEQTNGSLIRFVTPPSSCPEGGEEAAGGAGGGPGAAASSSAASLPRSTPTASATAAAAAATAVADAFAAKNKAKGAPRKADGGAGRDLASSPSPSSSSDSAAAASPSSSDAAAVALSPPADDAFSRLRFFDSCGAYIRYKNEKSWRSKVAVYTRNSTRRASHEWGMLSTLFATPFLEELAAAELLRRGKDGEEDLNALLASAATRPSSADGGSADDDAALEDEADAADLDALLSGGGGAAAAAAGSSPAPPAPSPASSSSSVPAATKRDARRLARRATILRRGASKNTLASLVLGLYKACQIDLNVYGRLDRTCAPFVDHLELMAKAELLIDLDDYYKQGAGEPVAFAASCILLEDFFAAGDAGAAGTPGTPMANFRFGHSETVMPFISMLSLYQGDGATTLDSYYAQELSSGTANLLNFMRRRLDGVCTGGNSSNNSSNSSISAGSEDAASCDRGEGAGAPFDNHLHVASSSSSSSSSRKGKGGGGGGGGKAATPVPTPLYAAGPADRAVPAGFSVAQLMALKHPWSGARLVPMAANIQWLLYDCGPEEDAEPGAGANATAAGKGGKGGKSKGSKGSKGSKKGGKGKKNSGGKGKELSVVIGSDGSGDRHAEALAADSAADDEDGDGAEADEPVVAAKPKRMSGLWAKMLHNEREIQFPACSGEEEGEEGEGGVEDGLVIGSNRFARPYGLRFPCPWERIKSFYRGEVYQKHGVNTCSAEDWRNMCGEPESEEGCA